MFTQVKVWFMVFQVVFLLVELARLGRKSESAKLPLIVLEAKLKVSTGRTIKVIYWIGSPFPTVAYQFVMYRRFCHSP